MRFIVVHILVGQMEHLAVLNVTTIMVYIWSSLNWISV